MRKRVEEIFGWTKETAGFRKTRHRGLARVSWMFTLTATAYNPGPAAQSSWGGSLAMLDFWPDRATTRNHDAPSSFSSALVQAIQTPTFSAPC